MAPSPGSQRRHHAVHHYIRCRRNAHRLCCSDPCWAQRYVQRFLAFAGHVARVHHSHLQSTCLAGPLLVAPRQILAAAEFLQAGLGSDLRHPGRFKSEDWELLPDFCRAVVTPPPADSCHRPRLGDPWRKI
eukprot:4663894-Amphidinium_carterae.1